MLEDVDSKSQENVRRRPIPPGVSYIIFRDFQVDVLMALHSFSSPSPQTNRRRRRIIPCSKLKSRAGGVRECCLSEESKSDRPSSMLTT